MISERKNLIFCQNEFNFFEKKTFFFQGIDVALEALADHPLKTLILQELKEYQPDEFSLKDVKIIQEMYLH